MEKIPKIMPAGVIIGPSVMNSMIGILLFMEIVSLTSAPTTIKCFESNSKGRDKTDNIILDCFNTTIGKSHKYSIEEWIRNHAFMEDGILANRVQQVNLAYNNFQRLFTLPTMQSLKKLSFKHNNISFIENQALSNLRALEELDLSYNSLKSYDLHPSMFFSNQRQSERISNIESGLKSLKLGYNNIHSLSPKFFKCLSKLEVLELSNNPLSVIDQNTELSLNYLTNLQLLDLGHTGLSEFPADMFSHMSNIETLYLNGNGFQKIPNEIQNMPLAYLNMNENPISFLDNESFVGLDKLQQLIISGMPNLADIGSGTFVPLKKLIILHMAQNPSLTNIHASAFGDHTTNKLSLRQLTISNTNLSSIDSNLYPWSKLDLFDAKGNPWMCDCRSSWLASYINETFAEMPEELLYYRCHEPKDLFGILVSRLNYHINCDHEPHQTHPSNNGHGQVSRFRHFIIVTGLVIIILVFGSLINKCCTEIKTILKPRLHVPARFSSGVKYKPADFEENLEPLEVPVQNITIYGRSPIVINNTD